MYDNIILRGGEILNKTIEFTKEVIKLSKKYDLPFFFVTDGASATNNKSCEAIRNARENHIKWEIENEIDPKHNWNKNN
jgi:RNase P/RNase MRP subunit p30